MYIWRYRDSPTEDWYYSEVAINPQKWLFVECYELLYSWEDGQREHKGTEDVS